MSELDARLGGKQRKGWRVALALLVLLLAGAAAGWRWLPDMVDANRYRDTVASLASGAIGRPVRIDGDIALHLTPQPVLTASGVMVPDSGDGVAMTVRELRLGVALGPLLRGFVDARELTLRGAVLNLPWPPPSGALRSRPPAWLSGLQAKVEDGQLLLGGLAVSALEGSVSTDPDTGALLAAATGHLGGRSWHFTARLGQPGGDGTATVDATIDGQGKLLDTGGSFSGWLGADGALEGRVAGRGADLSLLLPAPPLPWRAEGRMRAAGGLAVADDLALQIAAAPARGAVALRVGAEPRLDLSVSAGQIDLDAWAPVLLRGARPQIPTSLDLSAEAATLLGGTVRRLRGAFDLQSDGVLVREMQALLPGEAQLRAEGKIGAEARFTGTGSLTAPDLRTTLGWVSPLTRLDVQRLPPGVLRTAQLRASAQADARGLTLTGLSGLLDGDRVQGALAVATAAAGPPATPPQAGTGAGAGPPVRPLVSATLEWEHLALDPWLPPAGFAPGPRAADPPDATLSLAARRATLRGMGLKDLSLDLQADAGRVVLRKAELSMGGFHAAGAGAVDAAGRVSDARFDMSATDLAALRPLLPARVGEGALWRGPATLQMQAAGPPEALALKIAAESGDLRIEAQPVLNLVSRGATGVLSLRHPGAPRLLEQLGAPNVAPWLGDGSISVLARFAWQPGRLAFDRLDVAAGMLRAGGQVALRWGQGVVPAWSGTVQAETLALPLPYPKSAEPLPVDLLQGWQATLKVEAGQVLAGLTPVASNVATALSVDGGVLRLDGLTATVGGGMLRGSAVLDSAALPPRLKATAQLDGAVVAAPLLEQPLDLLSATMDARVDLGAEGHSPIAMLATLAGPVAVQLRDGVLGGVDLAAAGAALAEDEASPVLLQRLRAALAGGTTAFTQGEAGGRIVRGVLAIDAARVSGPAGQVTVGGTADLAAGTLDMRLGLNPVPPGTRPEGEAGWPEIAVGVTGPAAAPRRTPELAPVMRWTTTR